jgi:MerR family copper efflux transcriptional regulator
MKASIGQAARDSGVSVKMIRHYEAIGLLPAAERTASNYRVYGHHEMHALRFIRRARALGFSMEEIRGLLALWHDKRRSNAAVKKIAARHAEDLRRRIAEMQSMAATLEHLMDNCRGDERPDCPILKDLASEGKRQ